jgi:hypothetical protein
MTLSQEAIIFKIRMVINFEVVWCCVILFVINGAACKTLLFQEAMFM